MLGYPGKDPAPPPLTVPPEALVLATPAVLPPNAVEVLAVVAVAGCARFTSIICGWAFTCCPGNDEETPVPRSTWLIIAAGRRSASWVSFEVTIKPEESYNSLPQLEGYMQCCKASLALTLAKTGLRGI